jgi:pimeloyl-ACP methyl ester carboxylesterase
MKLFSRNLGNGYPLVILHGLMGFSDNWITLGKKWSEKYRVLLPDARNHGLSPHSETFNYDVMAKDLLGFLQDQQINDCYMIGHSMGGKTAMHLAIHHPEFVRKLVVADMGVKKYPIKHDHLLDALLSLQLDKFTSRKDVEGALSKKISDPGIRMFLLKNLHRGDAGAFQWKANISVLRDRLDDLGNALPLKSRAEMPTLFIRGERSDYIEDLDIPGIKNHFPLVSIQTLAGAGHWLHAEKPDQFYQMVNEFFDNPS